MKATDVLPDRRNLGIWLILLAGAQCADVLTTAVDLQHGGIEANSVVAHLLAVGGIGLVFVLKLLLVAAVVLAAWLLDRYATRQPALAVAGAHRLLRRGVQLSVIGLVLVAVHNTVLLTLIV